MKSRRGLRCNSYTGQSGQGDCYDICDMSTTVKESELGL